MIFYQNDPNTARKSVKNAKNKVYNFLNSNKISPKKFKKSLIFFCDKNKFFVLKLQFVWRSFFICVWIESTCSKNNFPKEFSFDYYVL